MANVSTADPTQTILAPVPRQVQQFASKSQKNEGRMYWAEVDAHGERVKNTPFGGWCDELDICGNPLPGVTLAPKPEKYSSSKGPYGPTNGGSGGPTRNGLPTTTARLAAIDTTLVALLARVDTLERAMLS